MAAPGATSETIVFIPLGQLGTAVCADGPGGAITLENEVPNVARILSYEDRSIVQSAGMLCSVWTRRREFRCFKIIADQVIQNLFDI